MAQIDLPNPKGTFLPGMYAYGSVLIERSNVRALPVSAVTQIGNQTYCYLVVDGKAVRTPSADRRQRRVLGRGDGEARPLVGIVGRGLGAVRRH